MSNISLSFNKGRIYNNITPVLDVSNSNTWQPVFWVFRIVECDIPDTMIEQIKKCKVEDNVAILKAISKLNNVFKLFDINLYHNESLNNIRNSSFHTKNSNLYFHIKDKRILLGKILDERVLEEFNTILRIKIFTIVKYFVENLLLN